MAQAVAENKAKIADFFAQMQADREAADRNPTFSSSYGISDGHFGITFDVNSHKREWADQIFLSARCCYDDLIRELRRLGFSIRPDPRIRKNYPTLSDTNRRGNHGRLEVLVECSGRCVSIEFFQSVNFENPSGGQYDFNRESKMPYLVRKRYEWTKLRLHEFCARNGIPLSDYSKKIKSPIPDPLAYYRGQWSTNLRECGENGWPSDKSMIGYHGKSADGDSLVNADNGSVAYFWCRGRWLRCRIYGGINANWLCIYGDAWTTESAYRISRRFRGRGRFFTDREKLESLRRDLARAIKRRDFRRADAIDQYAKRAGIDLVGKEMQVTIGANQ